MMQFLYGTVHLNPIILDANISLNETQTLWGVQLWVKSLLLSTLLILHPLSSKPVLLFTLVNLIHLQTS